MAELDQLDQECPNASSALVSVRIFDKLALWQSVNLYSASMHAGT